MLCLNGSVDKSRAVNRQRCSSPCHEKGVVAKKRWTERELRIQFGQTKFFVDLLAGGTDMRISPHASWQVPSEETHVYR